MEGASYGGVARPRGGRPVAGVDGNWACPECQNVNFAQRDACNRCQVPKPPDDGADLTAALSQLYGDDELGQAAKRMRTEL